MIVAVANGKGGTDRTVLAASLAAELNPHGETPDRNQIFAHCSLYLFFARLCHA
jgi:hypothetical protein